MNPLIIQNRIIIELIINVGIVGHFNKNHINNVIIEENNITKIVKSMPKL